MRTGEQVLDGKGLGGGEANSPLPPLKIGGGEVSLLAAYGMDQPYDLNSRIAQGKWLLKQEVGIRFALGCILMEIKEHESFQTFGKILTDEFGGMHKSAAYNYITFARKCMALPKLRQFAEGNWSKAITLMHSCSEGELQELEGNEQLLDEYDGMGVREFKRLIRDLKEGVDRRSERELRRLQEEHERTQRRLKAMERRYGGSEDEQGIRAWVEVNRQFIGELAGNFLYELRIFADSEKVYGSEEAYEYLSSLYVQVQTDLGLINERYMKRSGRSFIAR